MILTSLVLPLLYNPTKAKEMIKKVVIAPSNAKAIAFLDELTKKKDEIKKKIAEKGTAAKKLSKIAQ